jgi:hypothetical protein
MVLLQIKLNCNLLVCPWGYLYVLVTEKTFRAGGERILLQNIQKEQDNRDA